MKTFLAGTAIALFLVTTAHAQSGNRGGLWCRDGAVDQGSTQMCQHNTYRQCMASRTGGESCYRNPRYGR
jgi:hypothetical protein